jgi:hypothetical protein
MNNGPGEPSAAEEHLFWQGMAPPHIANQQDAYYVARGHALRMTFSVSC